MWGPRWFRPIWGSYGPPGPVGYPPDYYDYYQPIPGSIAYMPTNLGPGQIAPQRLETPTPGVDEVRAEAASSKYLPSSEEEKASIGEAEEMSTAGKMGVLGLGALAIFLLLGQ